MLLVGDPGGGHDDAGGPAGGDAGCGEAVDEHHLGHGRAADVAGADHGDRVGEVGVVGRRQVGGRDGGGHAGQGLAHGAGLASRARPSTGSHPELFHRRPGRDCPHRSCSRQTGRCPQPLPGRATGRPDSSSSPTDERPRTVELPNRRARDHHNLVAVERTCSAEKHYPIADGLHAPHNRSCSSNALIKHGIGRGGC